MSRILIQASCIVALVCSLGWYRDAAAQPPSERKQLDTLEGYHELPGEKGTKKAIEGMGKAPVETVIVWSDAKPTSGSAPLTVEFTVDPLEGAKSPKYSWDFGDGSPGGEGTKVSHTYSKPGVYRAMLKVTDNTGDLGDDEQRIKVTR
jgi:hypothetical protein